MQNKTDVLIIGGGVIGLACAYYLLKEGRSVRIIEKDTIGKGASAGNCGFIFSSHILPLCSPGTVKSEFQRFLSGTSQLIIKPALDISRLMWLLNFARKCNPAHLFHAISAREEILRHSKFLYENIFSENAFQCDQKQNGILIVFKTKKEFEKYSETIRWLEEFSLPVEKLVGDDMFKLEPALSKEVHAAWFYKTDAHLRPEKLLENWKQAIIRIGGIVEENCELRHFNLTGKRITGISTSNGMYAANDVVLAAGAWTAQISKWLKLKVPIQPAKGYSITFNNDSKFPEIPCIFYEKRIAATLWGNEGRLGGIMEFCGLNSISYAHRIRQIHEGANEYLSKPLAINGAEEWSGFRPMSYDDLPVIGRSARYPNLILAAGHGTTGLSMAPSTGKLVSEIIAGKKPFMDISAYSSDRF